MKTTTRKMQCAKPATGTVRVLQPLGTIPGQSSTCEICINGANYLVHFASDCEVVELVKACTEKDAEPTVYLLSPEFDCCNCPSALYGNRPDGCKHQKALKALRNAKKL